MAVLGARAALGCGPWFPNSLLDSGDEALLQAPEVSFQSEIERIPPAPVPFRALVSTNSFVEQTRAAELADLEQALRAANLPPERQHAIVEAHLAERCRIDFVSGPAYTLRPSTNTPSRVGVEPPRITPGLPPEFADYFRGSIAWHQGQVPVARAAWGELLERPAAARHFKTTWAAFMLGRSWEDERRTRAIEWFQEVRAFTTNGFADRLGLAAASLGYEARLHVRDGHYARAIELYLDQLSAGDPESVRSLHAAASFALQHPDADLREIAANPRARRVLTAYALSLPLRPWQRPGVHVDGPVKELVLRAIEKVPRWATNAAAHHRFRDPADRWLAAVEAAKVRDVELAEGLALVAYQVNQLDRAARWLKLAAPTPAAQWLRAKLLFRDGNIEEGTALLASVSKRFPAAISTNAVSQGLAGSLYVSAGAWQRPSPGEQVQRELGVLYLSSRQYGDALHALLLSGYWQDAAYVAERVLTPAELKDYVDHFWPTAPSTISPVRDLGDGDPPFDQGRAAYRVRHLLARRLAREGRWGEAHPYYPADQQPGCDTLQRALAVARQENLRAVERGRAFFQAARITRYQGMELLGTELEPDWAIWSGDYEGSSLAAYRTTNVLVGTLRASGDELQRAAQHGPGVNERFHYRYLAAELAWEAARLLPNNSDETARVLCLGGSWLKNRDPRGADRFYKSLVRRCGKTALGAEADRLRWFPSVDEEGNWPPRRPPAEATIAAPGEDDQQPDR
jgi:hypothetical protein